MKSLVNPFRNILRLSIGDFLAKTLNFLAFLYLARVLGVTRYGVFEFAVAILTYFMLLADGGLEFYATRQTAQGEDIRYLVERIVPLRFLLGAGAFGLLLLALPLFPDYPGLRTVLLLFGLTLFTYTLNLKWVFMGRERMGRVALGLVISQIVFSVTIFAFIHNPEQVVWVPLLWLAGDAGMGLYFWWLFARSYGGLRLHFTLRGTRRVLKPAFTIGTSQAMGLMSYNFDALLLGFLLGPNPVGLYRAAYKPITAALAMPLTYFLGLFPALSRTYRENLDAFDGIVRRSLNLTAIFALPLGIGGTFMAGPIINLLFGPDYSPAVPAMRLLSWSASLIILRDTFRQALIAADKQHLDLRAAGTAVVSNVILNFILIPRFGIVGAATATILSEIVWLSVAAYYYSRFVSHVNPLSHLFNPVIAAIGMAAWFYLGSPVFWPIQAVLAVLVYFGVLYLLGEREVRSFLRFGKALGQSGE